MYNILGSLIANRWQYPAKCEDIIYFFSILKAQQKNSKRYGFRRQYKKKKTSDGQMHAMHVLKIPRISRDAASYYGS